MTTRLPGPEQPAQINGWHMIGRLESRESPADLVRALPVTVIRLLSTSSAPFAHRLSSRQPCSPSSSPVACSRARRRCDPMQSAPLPRLRRGYKRFLPKSPSFRRSSRFTAGYDFTRSV